ncbi:MAG: DUF3604 domain-containing protein [Chloroflexia bacterium]|nr:DUF3604 domain-containing protein [Chloroflexia bacterium]
MPDDQVVAGQLGTWSITYVVGVAGIDDGGRIRLAFRNLTDWATPQFIAPAEPNYASVRATRPVALTPVFGLDGVRPWAKTMTISIADGTLAHGDQVTIVLGDTMFGGPGMRAQTYPERCFRIKLQVDPFGTGLYENVTDLRLSIIGGPATQIVVVAPSDVVADELSWLQVRALDRWGNPDPDYRGMVSFAGDTPEGCPGAYQFGAHDRGVHRFEGLRYCTAGSRPLAIRARDQAGGLAAISNPIRCHASPPPFRLFWGDLHGQTEETIGTGSISEYFTYARDVAAVDAVAHSGNDFQITNHVYKELRESAQRFYEPGRFVTFHGYEWSGNTPAGGDHNVYYFGDGPIRRSSHTEVEDKHDIETDCYPISHLYAVNAGRDDVLITPHVGGRRANLDYHDQQLEPAIEIASQWGRFEWFALDALARGLRVAFVGGSDDHSGRPGWSAPTLAHHGVRGGLTAYLATDLTREAIWDALRSRRCYGTSGPRIVVDVSVSGHPMGSEPILTQRPVVAVDVLGTAPLDTVELRRGLATVFTHTVRPAPDPNDPWRIRVAWRGARNRDRSRALDWGGELSVSNGRITAAENFAIDNPLDGIIARQPDRITWRSHTCGDWDGVILDLDGDADTVLHFSSPTMQFSCSLETLANGPVEHAGFALNQRVVVERLSHQVGALETQFEWSDESPVDGVNPYWIWVTQSDGELAWSSPVYVTWKPGSVPPAMPMRRSASSSGRSMVIREEDDASGDRDRGEHTETPPNWAMIPTKRRTATHSVASSAACSTAAADRSCASRGTGLDRRPD